MGALIIGSVDTFFVLLLSLCCYLYIINWVTLLPLKLDGDPKSSDVKKEMIDRRKERLGCRVPGELQPYCI
jgi:hypothetical protein